MGTLSLTLAILTGSYDIDIDEPERINYLQSDILLDSAYFFYASKENLYKLHKDGTIIWTKKFKKKKISRSTLLKRMFCIGYVSKKLMALSLAALTNTGEIISLMRKKGIKKV